MASEEVMSKQSSRDTALSVVIPTYMEKESLPELIGRIESSLRSTQFEIVIVDDSSPDGTADCAEDLNREFGNIKVVRRGGKLGLASAVLDGFQIAGADVLAVMDADLQHPPELLPQMYSKVIEGYDLVVASRYGKGGAIEGWSLRRRMLSRGAMILAHMLLPTTRRVKDVMSGFLMLRREVIEGVKLNPVGFKILLEIVAKGNCNSVAEVPYTFGPRKKGKSSLGFREVWNFMVHVYWLL